MFQRRRGTSSLPEQGAEAHGRLARSLQRARWAALWEGIWPPLASVATGIGLFLAASWAGLWLALPPLGRAFGLFGFVVLLALAAVPLIRIRWPSHLDALRRIDRESGLRHRPATAIADELATGAGDQVSVALWQAHLERALRAAKALRAGLPRPRLSLRDPLALRALTLLLVVTTYFAAGGDHVRRITAALDWAGVVTPANFRIDSWITPPVYTGRPPVILPGLRPGERTQALAPQTAPTGSLLVVRSTGSISLDIDKTGGIAEAAETGTPKPPAGTQERRFTIRESGTVTVRGPSGDVVWAITAIPDRPPAIALTKEPEPQARGAVRLDYKIEDDYGVVGAEAKFKLKQAATAEGRPPRGLFGPPDFPLVLPQARTRNGAGQTIKDLSEHPWAGAEVEMTLVARDEAENEGRSSAHVLKLPERPFYKPVARALVEQRRSLALDADSRSRVLAALDALTLGPDVFGIETGVYLGLRSIYWELMRARNDDALRNVVARLWQMAVGLEDGNVSDAEQALRAAQDALQQALERGASDEEIRRLMDNLRAAMDKFLQALAEEMRKNPQLARPLDPNARQLRSQDLKSMLDRLENLARSGAKDAARQMLEELRSMLENLQMARPGMQGDGDDDMMSALDELGDMVRRQQQLRDRTFRQGQEQRRGQRGQRGQQGQQGQQGQEQGDSFADLQQNQQALREQLKKLLEELRKRGQMGQPGQADQDGAQGLGQAEKEMRDAEGALGDGNADGAVGSQGRALEALRKGAQGLAQQMQQGGPGQGPGQPGRTGPARAQQDTDPLGRPLRGRDYGDDVSVKVPGEIDVQRARRILEELRRRFGDAYRPQIELEYIERLLRDF